MKRVIEWVYGQSPEFWTIASYAILCLIGGTIIVGGV
jgi:hypothetical protein